ncbi:MAG: hypothetical protein OXC91_11670 [Rhodobacteraceae bacterium]|nr:hypothetical protein [Paracoccaceae bacterium]
MHRTEAGKAKAPFMTRTGMDDPGCRRFRQHFSKRIIMGCAFIEPVDFSKFSGFMPCGLGLHVSIEKPADHAPRSGIEPTAIRMYVRKRCVDDAAIRDTGYQLVDSNPRLTSVFRQPPIIGRAVGIEQAGKVVIIPIGARALPPPPLYPE